MKALIFILLVLAPCAHLKAYDEARLLATIRLIETGDDASVRGAAGERSAYQITPAVWRQHMGGMPFARAMYRIDADACALRHVRWLAAGLRRHGYEPTPARLALAWNIGLTGAIRRELRLTDYARRTANLYATR